DLGEHVERFGDLQDCWLLLKLVYKLKGQEPSQAPVDLTQEQRQYIILDFLHGVCQEQIVLPSEEPTSNREQQEIQLAKVVLLLCFIGLINNELVPKVEFETELQMASMFRHVQQGEQGFSLSEGLHKLLTVSPLLHTSSSSSTSSYSEEGSPFFTRSRSPLVSFLELNTVASSSFVSSPIQEIINTPQVQLKRLRKELAREGDVRDELERELSEHISTISEKEGQISQLQHRLQRLLRDQEELEKEHKFALLELQQKNEGSGPQSSMQLCMLLFRLAKYAAKVTLVPGL
ncbi:hypothetical protein AOLI_G00326790, partial [Acnodon oligacanthus]